MRVRLKKVTRAASTLALLGPLALAWACGGGASKNAQQSNAAAPQSNANAPQSSAQSNTGGVVAPSTAADVEKLSADIERLEKGTERNPGDEETRDELARAYVRRGDAQRSSNQPQEALKDYQRALRLDPDNDEAQKNAADMQEQLGGEQQDENGAPAPAPITPNVTDDEDKPAPSVTPTATPRKQ
jgi:tetratricopeptide (TPR) repeat protein